MVAVLSEVEGSVEGVLDVGEDRVEGGEPGVGGVHLSGDPLLFGSEQFGWDGVLVVGLEEFAALVVELGEQGPLVAAFELGVGASGAEAVVDVVA